MKLRKLSKGLSVAVYLFGAIVILTEMTGVAQAQIPGPIAYSAKFICGQEKGDNRVARGKYSSTINIHNPHLIDVDFRKKAVIALPERSKRGKISEYYNELLRPDEAMGVDCKDIRGLFSPPISSGFIEGFLVLELFPLPGSNSRTPKLDVVGVYTARHRTGTGDPYNYDVETIDVEQYEPKEIIMNVVAELPDLIPVPDANGFFCRPDPNGKLIVTVKNQGAGSAGGTVTMVDFFSYGSFAIATPPLAPGASADLTVDFPLGCFDSDCEFKITADSSSVETESDETNNTATDRCIG